MAPISTQTGSSLDGRDRRVCARHQVKSLAYLDIGADNGGIVLNISESGVAVHAVSVLPPEPLVDLRLQLPRSSKRLETKGKVAWTSSTKKEAGVEFVDLPAEVRLEIREWLASENLEPVYVESSVAAEQALPVRRQVRKDKWTNLVSELTSIPAGIERSADDRAASTYPVTVPKSLSVEETAVPASPETHAITTSEERATSAQLTDSLVADQQGLCAESNSIAPPDLIDSAFSPSPDPVGDPQYRKSNPELSLPSDKLLNSPLPISIVPSRGSKTDNAKASRNLREAGSSDADGDDFLRKARALFGPKHIDKPVQEVDDPAPVVAPVLAATAGLPPIHNGTGQKEAQPAMSDLIATSTPSSEPLTPNALRPITSIPLEQDSPRGSEPKRRSPAMLPARGLDLRNFLSILALCILLSVGCLVLGIVVGRSAATHSQNAAAARYNGASQTAPPDERNGASSNQFASPSTSPRAQTQTQDHAQDAKFARDQKPRAETPRRGRSARSSEDTAASSVTVTDGPDSTSSREQGAGSTGSAVSPPANTNAAGVIIAPAAAASATTSASGSRTSPQPEPGPAPRSQLPPDRMVAAYLIYRVEPIYPRSALQGGIEGIVKIHATVSRDGTVKNLKVVSGPSQLTPAAIDAAQYWRYIPALRNGEPVETETDISIEFHRPR